MKTGYDIFGKAYAVMLRNDLHDIHSIDHWFLKTMILLEQDSYDFLYQDPVSGSDLSSHELYAFSQQFKKSNDRDTIEAVLKFTSDIAADYNVDFEDMLFGGTEKEIIDRGTDWCADMARVCCVILQCLHIPCRIVHLMNVEKAYNGHVVCEAFYEGTYGVVDPIFGYQFYEKGPLSAYDLLNNHKNISFGYEGYMDLYASIAINEYDPCDPKNNYAVSKPNDYYLTLIAANHNDQWIMDEDKN